MRKQVTLQFSVDGDTVLEVVLPFTISAWGMEIEGLMQVSDVLCKASGLCEQERKAAKEAREAGTRDLTEGPF